MNCVYTVLYVNFLSLPLATVREIACRIPEKKDPRWEGSHFSVAGPHIQSYLYRRDDTKPHAKKLNAANDPLTSLGHQVKGGEG